eukprot:Skav200344  [mRNA]  locus=scaffold2819:20333:22752:- [translate_table: standard]
MSGTASTLRSSGTWSWRGFFCPRRAPAAAESSVLVLSESSESSEEEGLGLRTTLSIADPLPRIVFGSAVEAAILAAGTAQELHSLFPEDLAHYRERRIWHTGRAPVWTLEARATRALRAGIAVRRVLDGVVRYPATSLKISATNTIYIVLRDPQSSEPWWCRSYDIYIEKLGQIEEQEVKILAYLLKCRSTGFMVALPAGEQVTSVLEQMIDEEDGTPLVVFKEVTVNLEDARGRRFGSGPMVLADFAAECAAFFRRTPSLRGAAALGILRLNVMNTVARPAVRNLLTVADQWIAEIAGQDDAMLDYFTAEEVGDGDPELAPVVNGAADEHAEVVRQMQARIDELQASLQTMQPAAPVDLEPRPGLSFGQGRTTLFDPSLAPSTVGAGALQRLRQLAGVALV